MVRCPAEGQGKWLALPPEAPCILGIQLVILQAQKNLRVNPKARQKTFYDSTTTFSDGRRSPTLTPRTHRVSPLSMHTNTPSFSPFYAESIMLGNHPAGESKHSPQPSAAKATRKQLAGWKLGEMGDMSARVSGDNHL